jgi:hemerythrin superfamily protein
VSAPRLLSSLMELHTELEDVFLLHQEALVERRFDLAKDLLAAYRRLLRTHMRHEEELILPIFERAGPVPRWPVVLYTGQHDKMLKMLDESAALLAAIQQEQAGVRRRWRSSFEATYKHLMGHHGGAEQQGLYPVVDRTATPREHADTRSLPRRGAAVEQEAELIQSAPSSASARRDWNSPLLPHNELEVRERQV